MKFLKWYRDLFWADRAVFVFIVACCAFLMIYAGSFLIVMYAGEVK